MSTAKVYTKQDARRRPSILGEEMQRCLKEACIRQSRLAELLREHGYPATYKYVYELIHGRNVGTHMDELKIICEFLSIPFDPNGKPERRYSGDDAVDYLNDPVYIDLTTNHPATVGALRAIAGELERPFVPLLLAVCDWLRCYPRPGDASGHDLDDLDLDA